MNPSKGTDVFELHRRSEFSVVYLHVKRPFADQKKTAILDVVPHSISTLIPLEYCGPKIQATTVSFPSTATTAQITE